MTATAQDRVQDNQRLFRAEFPEHGPAEDFLPYCGRVSLIMGAAESREDATRSDRRILHGPSKPAQRLPTDRDQNPSKGGKGDVEYWKALGLVSAPRACPAAASQLSKRALVQIIYPDEDEEEDTDICKVVDGLYLGGEPLGMSC